MMRKLAVVADYLDDSHRTHIEKMASPWIISPRATCLRIGQGSMR